MLEEDDDQGDQEGEGEEQGQEVSYSQRDVIYLNSERETQPEVFQMSIYEQPTGGFEETESEIQQVTKVKKS